MLMAASTAKTPGCKPRRSAPRAPSRPRLGSGDTFEESIQKLDLRRVELPARLVEIEEPAAIHLGKLLKRAGARRPFEAKGVASHFFVFRPGAFESPGLDDLAAALAHASQRDRIGAEPALHGASAGLLLELAGRHGESGLPRLDQALGDRPHAVLLAREERTTGMDEEELPRRPLAPVHEKP